MMEIPFSSSVLCSVFGSASGASPHGAREAVRGAVDDDPVGESPLEKPLEPAGRLGERDGVFGESGREMEGLSRKQDTKSFEVCVRHVTVDLEGREGACGGGRGNGPENVRFVCVDDGRDGHREAEGLRAFLDLIREDRESFGCDRSG